MEIGQWEHVENSIYFGACHIFTLLIPMCFLFVLQIEKRFLWIKNSIHFFRISKNCLYEICKSKTVQVSIDQHVSNIIYLVVYVLTKKESILYSTYRIDANTTALLFRAALDNFLTKSPLFGANT